MFTKWITLVLKIANLSVASDLHTVTISDLLFLTRVLTYQCICASSSAAMSMLFVSSRGTELF